MRDDSRRWPEFNLDKAPVKLGDVILSSAKVARQTVISGPLENALKLCGLEKAQGWPDVVTEETYALRLRRDRILVVNGPPLEDGWHAEHGLAVSDMSGGLVVFEIDGPGALPILRRGTEINVNEPSLSVTRRLWGHATEIYRYQGNNRLRLHVPVSLSFSLRAAIVGQSPTVNE